MFELDGKKIYCNKDDIYSPTGKCGGLIDYDIGFNNLICEKCGKRYLAIELKKYKKEYSIMLKGDDTMKVSIRKGKETIKKFNHSITTSDVISKESAKKMARVCNNGEDDKYKYTPNYSLMGEESSTMRVSVKVPTSEIKEDEDRNPDKLNINEKKESETIPNQSEFNQNTSVQNSPEIDESFGIAKDIHEINISKDSEKESDEKIVEKEISMSIDPIPEVTESEEKIVEDEEDDDEEIQIIPRNNNILDQEVVDEF